MKPRLASPTVSLFFEAAKRLAEVELAERTVAYLTERHELVRGIIGHLVDRPHHGLAGMVTYRSRLKIKEDGPGAVRTLELSIQDMSRMERVITYLLVRSAVGEVTIQIPGESAEFLSYYSEHDYFKLHHAGAKNLLEFLALNDDYALQQKALAKQE